METNNGTPACASCKHQRKKCTNKCILAPYFPVEKTAEFQAVHKLYGVSNITKHIKSLDPRDRQRTVDELIWEATCRQNDPVLGAFGEYQRLYELYQRDREELRSCKSQNPPIQHQVPAPAPQLLQVPPQNGVMYQSRPPAAVSGLPPWGSNNRIGINNNINNGAIINNNNGGLNHPNNNGGMANNNNGLNNRNNDGSPSPHNYAPHPQHEQNLERVRQERENGSVLVWHPYYTPGKYLGWFPISFLLIFILFLYSLY